MSRAPLPTMTLDRGSFEPLYNQLHRLLRQSIESGRWEPGGLMPSEPELCRHFGVSRMVVRQALAALEDDHLVTRRRGRGTFVAEPRVRRRAESLVRTLQAPRPPGLVIDVLESSLGETGILRVTTLLTLNDQPLAVTRSSFDGKKRWPRKIPADGRIPDDLTLSLGSAELGQPHVSIAVGGCSELAGRQLGIPAGTPVYVARITEGDSGGARRGISLEVAECEWRADELDCRVTVSPTPPPAMIATFGQKDSVSV